MMSKLNYKSSCLVYNELHVIVVAAELLIWQAAGIVTHVVLLVRNRITVSEVIVSNEWSLYCGSFSSYARKADFKYKYSSYNRVLYCHPLYSASAD